LPKGHKLWKKLLEELIVMTSTGRRIDCTAIVLPFRNLNKEKNKALKSSVEQSSVL
jgi:hypothetical protein